MRRMTVLCMYVGLLIGCVHFNAGADGHISKTALVGQHVILPCSNVIRLTNCETTTWVYSAIELVTHGEIRTENSERAKRMSLTSDCFLNISDIRHEDYGYYYCQQYLYKNGPKYGDDTTVCLTVKEDENGATTPNNKGAQITTPNNKAGDDRDNGHVNEKKEEIGGSSNGRNEKWTILSVVVALALSLTVLIAWLIYRRRAQSKPPLESNGKTTAVQQSQNNTFNGHNDGEDTVTYSELNHNETKPRIIDIDNEYQKSEYATIKLS